MTSPRRFLLFLAVLSLAPASFSAQQADSPEELARRWLSSGLKFLREGKAGEGLKDLQRVAESYPTSPVADDALLEIAMYQLGTAGDVAAARAVVDVLLTKYPSADTAPMAYVLSGRIGLAQAETIEGVDQALANFERVRTLFPRSPAVAAALMYAGEAQRVGRRLPEAVQFFQQVAAQYPRSPWAARGLLGLTQASVALGRPQQALEALARVQVHFPESPEATQARDWATILYRLHVRSPGAPAYTATDRAVAGPAGRLEDVEAIAVEADGHVAVLSRDGVSRFGRDNRVVDTARAMEARALMARRDGQLVVALKGGLQLPAPPPLALAAPRSDGAARPLEDIRALGLSRTGQFLVADGGTRSIMRFSADGRHAGGFAAVDATRLAVNDVGLVAVLERNARTVAVFDPAGRPAGRVPATGTGYDLREPVDVAWDALGHLYVLEREVGAVAVFSPSLQLVTNFTLSQKSPATFRRATAFAVDAAGRLFIHEDRTKVIRVYQ
jgi:TolA-binding protein